MLDETTNYGRWSETAAVRLPETESGLRILENMSSVSVLEFQVTLFGCIMCDKNIWEEREPRNSLVVTWWSYFSRFTLKSPYRKTDLLSFEILSSKGLTVIKLGFLKVVCPGERGLKLTPVPPFIFQEELI